MACGFSIGKGLFRHWASNKTDRCVNETLLMLLTDIVPKEKTMLIA